MNFAIVTNIAQFYKTDEHLNDMGVLYVIRDLRKNLTYLLFYETNTKYQ